jgi:molybdopterin-dependent oxidoreductase alpha subunit
MRDFSPEPPLESNPPQLQARPKSATGLPAILKSFQVSWRQLGLAKLLPAWLKVNQQNGFDCPSCAWADPIGHRSPLEFCENGAKAFADDATTKLCDPAFFAQHSLESLANQSDQWLNAQGRLAHPMYLAENATHYRKITWSEAIARVALELRGCDSPDEAVFYTSGKAINESAFLLQLFARRYGTNNLPDCSNMCHESSGVALQQSVGTGKSTVILEDLEGADVILVVGQNPGTNHPRMLTSLEKAKKRGATIIAINPLREVGLERFTHPQSPFAILSGGTPLANLYLQVRINGDVALFQGLAKGILALGGFDQNFIEKHTHGFAEYRSHLASVSWEQITRESGLSRESIEAAAKILDGSKGTVACWAMGLTQHVNGVDNVRELTNLLLLGGHIGRPNAGLFCVRGHSNVQGDRTMGVAEHMPEPFYQAMEAEFQFRAPRKPGYNTIETIEAMLRKRVRVFFSLGGNFVSATPDTNKVAQGIRNCRLTVSIATKLNRSHVITGQAALILPCLSRTELDQPGTVENTVSWVSLTQGIFPPVSPYLRSEAAIIARIADTTLNIDDFQPLAKNYAKLRDRIARVIPGFENFNKRLKSGGFYAPVPSRQRDFLTPSTKAEFALTRIRPQQLGPGQLLMMTIRTHDQFNTVVYGNDDRYRGIHNGRRVILLHPEDIKERNWSPLQLVDITSHFKDQVRTVEGFRVVPYDIPRGNAATYFPEANPLVPIEHHAEQSFTPASKSVVITVSPSLQKPTQAQAK